MRPDRLTPGLFAAALVVLAAPAAAKPAASVLAADAPAIVRIVASDCGADAARSGSGFAWQTPGQIVTALHVVAGCDALGVDYEGVGERPARVQRILRAADLVLLSVAEPPPVAPLTASFRVPVGATVVVYGYALGEPTPEERPLYVTSASIQAPLLSDAVNQEARDELRSLGAPALETEVLRVDGNLLPGHSGAPVLDDDGQVIGIGSGGLQRGTVGVGWAIRAHYLSDLADAPTVADGTAPPLGNVANAPGYATVSPRAGPSGVHCGELDFVRTRTGLSLGTLVESSDDQRGFEQIAATADRPWDVLAAIQFDIWTEASSGAGVAVPTGGELRPAPLGCTANWENGVVSLSITGAVLPDPGDWQWLAAAQDATVGFEASWVQEFFPYLQLDPWYSYGPPRTAPGGLLVNRKTFVGQRPDGSLPYAAFETLLAKGRASINVVAITRHYHGPMTPPPDEATYRAWIAAVFAAALSTVPP